MGVAVDLEACLAARGPGKTRDGARSHVVPVSTIADTILVLDLDVGFVRLLDQRHVVGQLVNVHEQRHLCGPPALRDCDE